MKKNIFAVLLVTFASIYAQAGITFNFYCIQESLDPNTVNVIMSDRDIFTWSSAERVTSKSKIEPKDLSRIVQAIWEAKNPWILEEEGRVSTAAEGLKIENVSILFRPAGGETPLYTLYVGPNNRMSFMKNEGVFPKYLLNIRSTVFGQKMNEVVSVDGTSIRGDFHSPSKITQSLCGQFEGED